MRFCVMEDNAGIPLAVFSVSVPLASSLILRQRLVKVGVSHSFMTWYFSVMKIHLRRTTV